jgi:hypothetical protein
MKNLVIVSSSSGDWSGLYKDGKLLIEDHSLRASEVLEVLGFEVERKEAEENWLEERGNLPKLLKDVKF